MSLDACLALWNASLPKKLRYQSIHALAAPKKGFSATHLWKSQMESQASL